jgi:hypothetical protein
MPHKFLVAALAGAAMMLSNAALAQGTAAEAKVPCWRKRLPP